MAMPEPSASRPATAPTILLVDHDTTRRRSIASEIATVGADIVEAADAERAGRLARLRAPDAIVLVLHDSEADADGACREMRAWSSGPLIVFASGNTEDAVVSCFYAGADDVLSPPFRMREFVARLRAQLRRGSPRRRETLHDLQGKGISIEFSTRRVIRNGHEVRLTPIEWRLLTVLAADAGRPISHRDLFDQVWHRPYGNPQQHLRVHITNLRRKVESDARHPALILTEPGVGYRFEYPLAPARVTDAPVA